MRQDGTAVISPFRWFESLACPLPYTTCSTESGASPEYHLGADEAHLFYFPESVGANKDSIDSSALVIHSYAPGITFTSPSVYVSFDSITAVSERKLPGSACSFCDYRSCVTTRVVAESTVEDIGTIAVASTIGMLKLCAPSLQRCKSENYRLLSDDVNSYAFEACVFNHHQNAADRISNEQYGP